MKSYPYQKTTSSIFGIVQRPFITIKIYSSVHDAWIPIHDALADTGADITLLPRYLGEIIVVDSVSFAIKLINKPPLPKPNGRHSRRQNR